MVNKIDNSIGQFHEVITAGKATIQTRDKRGESYFRLDSQEKWLWGGDIQLNKKETEVQMLERTNAKIHY